MTQSDPESERRQRDERERAGREAGLDETIAASFPASDPPSTNPNPDEPDAVRDVVDPPGHRQSSA